jgi:asparagine synthase (glutamine-hydrolysing)
MCGINGFVSSCYHEEHIVRMNRALKHRGPDADGVYLNKEKGIGLGHTRLSILDTSSSANQPMFSKNNKYVVVFNGEIYNFKEIAHQIDVNLNTASDTAVILAAFEKWHTDMVAHFNGMFAIAIYDIQQGELYFFRDRLGIKPLYYYQHENDFVFSSELKGIMTLQPKLTHNMNAIEEYLHLGFISGEKTIFNEIKKFPAGHFGMLKNNKLTTTPFWKISDKIEPQTHQKFHEVKKHLHELLTISVQHRLISDVPLGTFLSGGTDSSLITAIASRINNDKLNTFSIGFKDATFNESEKAKKIAQHLQTNHHEFIVTENDALEEWEKIMDNFDEPMADSSAIPTYLVSKLAKKHVTVCLSGDGGDELFLGYGAYQWAKRLKNPLFWHSRKIISTLLHLSSSDRNKRAAMMFNAPSNNTFAHILSQEQYFFTHNEIQQLLNKKTTSIFSKIKTYKRDLTPSELQALFDIEHYLKDDLLVKVDRASMLSGLEVRVPFLDYHVVEYAINIDAALKVKNGSQKYILKEILKDYVPEKLTNHPKQGFAIPLQKWLTKELSFLIDNYLNKDSVENIGLCQYQPVNELVVRFKNGETFLYNRIWNLILLHRFLIKFPLKN